MRPPGITIHFFRAIHLSCSCDLQEGRFLFEIPHFHPFSRSSAAAALSSLESNRFANVLTRGCLPVASEAASYDKPAYASITRVCVFSGARSLAEILTSTE